MEGSIPHYEHRRAERTERILPTGAVDISFDPIALPYEKGTRTSRERYVSNADLWGLLLPTIDAQLVKYVKGYDGRRIDGRITNSKHVRDLNGQSLSRVQIGFDKMGTGNNLEATLDVTVESSTGIIPRMGSYKVPSIDSATVEGRIQIQRDAIAWPSTSYAVNAMLLRALANNNAAYFEEVGSVSRTFRIPIYNPTAHRMGKAVVATEETLEFLDKRRGKDSLHEAVAHFEEAVRMKNAGEEWDARQAEADEMLSRLVTLPQDTGQVNRARRVIELAIDRQLEHAQKALNRLRNFPVGLSDYLPATHLRTE